MPFLLVVAAADHDGVDRNGLDLALAVLLLDLELDRAVVLVVELAAVGRRAGEGRSSRESNRGSGADCDQSSFHVPSSIPSSSLFSFVFSSNHFVHLKMLSTIFDAEFKFIDLLLGFDPSSVNISKKKWHSAFRARSERRMD